MNLARRILLIAALGAVIALAIGLRGLVQSEAQQDGSRQSERKAMVRMQLARRGIRNPEVLRAMRKVPRHKFVPETWQNLAYQDRPLRIGHGQTISQPYVVALMTEVVGLKPTSRVLEIGTGSGYQAAILAELVREVYTIELIGELARQAQTRLSRLGYRNIHVRTGDGYLGWPEAGPFDAIIVTCGADQVPEPLFKQLKPTSKMVIPVGPAYKVQMLRLIEKGTGGQRIARDIFPVRFVPLRRKENRDEGFQELGFRAPENH